MDPHKPSGPSMFSGAQHFSARGGQYNTTSGDIGVVLHINCSEGHGASGEPSTNVDPGNIDHARRRIRISDILRIFREPEADIVDLAQHEPTSLGSRVNASAVMPKRSELYSRLMLQHGHGYPLYEPNPGPAYRRTGVRVGDIGWVTPDGAFDCLYNVIHALPDTLELEALQHFRDEEDVLSDHVTQTDGWPITYQCSHSEGAILRLPEGATRFEAKNPGHLRNLAARHAYDWYKYMMVDRARIVPNGSLFLITGCTKTKSWSIATFHGRPDDSNCLQFNADGQTRRLRYGWTAKIGPNTDDAITGELNQCVFLRGWRITLSQNKWKKLDKIAAFASQSKVTGLPSVRITLINQEGSRNQNQSTLQASAPSHATHSLSELEETAGLGDQGLCNPSLSNAADNDVEEDAVEEDTMDEDVDEDPVYEDAVEELAGVASPMHPSNSINPILPQPEADFGLNFGRFTFGLAAVVALGLAWPT